MSRLYRIQLDICSICNLNCSACWMRKFNYGDIKAGYLTFDNFKNFVDLNKEYIENIEISNSGEPFLNPDSIKILQYAYELNIPLTCKNGTNFNFQNDDLLKAMVDYKLRTVYIAIDGATEETYLKYRRNGNFNLVMSNLKKLVEYKKQTNSKYPEIVWQYIVRESTDNPNEIINAKKIANELGIRIDFKLTWEKDYKPNEIYYNDVCKLIGCDSLFKKDIKRNGINKWVYHKCKVAFFDEKITINWNGFWLICCGNKRPTNINVFEVGLKGLFESKTYKDIKSFIKYGYPTNTICSFCPHSKDIGDLNNFICEQEQNYISDTWKDLL